MTRPNHPTTAQKVYTLCYRLTACRSAAALLTARALADPEPLRQAVRLSMAEASQSVPDDFASPLERSLFSLPPKERLAVLLLDNLHLSPASASRWAEMPEPELLSCAHRAGHKFSFLELSGIFFSNIFFIHRWLNLKMQNSWIQRATYIQGRDGVWSPKVMFLSF